MFAKEKTLTVKWLFPSTVILALVLGACGGQPPAGGTGGETGSGGETGGDATAAPTEAESGPAGACANPYYPVVNGATRTYSVTGGEKDFSYTETITDASSDGFTLSTAYSLEGNLQTTQHWGCQSDGLVALEYNGGPSAALSTEGLSAQFNTTSVTGITVPADLAVGSTWTQSMEFEGNYAIAEGMSGPVTGSVSSAANAVGTESVSTAAGTFDAIKVELQQDISMTATIGGISMPITITGVTTAWYAPGVGIMKQVTTEDLMGTTITIELQSYSIP